MCINAVFRLMKVLSVFHNEMPSTGGSDIFKRVNGKQNGSSEVLSKNSDIYGHNCRSYNNNFFLPSMRTTCGLNTLKAIKNYNSLSEDFKECNGISKFKPKFSMQ